MRSSLIIYVPLVGKQDFILNKLKNKKKWFMIVSLGVKTSFKGRKKVKEKEKSRIQLSFLIFYHKKKGIFLLFTISIK